MECRNRALWKIMKKSVRLFQIGLHIQKIFLGEQLLNWKKRGKNWNVVIKYILTTDTILRNNLKLLYPLIDIKK